MVSEKMCAGCPARPGHLNDAGLCVRCARSGTKSPSAATAIGFRLRRVICEDAYVAVPVTEAVMKRVKDGSFMLDVDRVTAEALRMGEDQGVEWRVEHKEGACVSLHPVQNAPPDNRTSFDGENE